jgi:hypothetical protein
MVILKPNLYIQTHYNSCSTTRLQLFCQTTLSNWSVCGDAVCVCVSYKPNFIFYEPRVSVCQTVELYKENN